MRNFLAFIAALGVLALCYFLIGPGNPAMETWSHGLIIASGAFSGILALITFSLLKKP